MSYIYKITNDRNGKMYIGKTEYTIEKRFNEHINDSKRERCEKRPLYDAMNKYGVEHFYIEIVEECKDEEAGIREQYWIKELRTYIGFKDCNGYNATLGGDSKKYKEYNIDDMIKMYNETHNIKLIAEKYNLENSHVGKLLKANGVKLLSTNEILREKYYKSIYQVELNTLKVLNVFKTRADANLYFGKNRENGTISDAIYARRGHHHAYGYDWYYEDEYLKLYNETQTINDDYIEEQAS
jgi:group I intron endonuclease